MRKPSTPLSCPKFSNLINRRSLTVGKSKIEIPAFGRRKNHHTVLVRFGFVASGVNVV
jgi:hypothetical protein